jgi:hypothetical protein
VAVVSLTNIDVVALPAVMVSVSTPSFNESLSSVTEIVATPLELTTALPLSEPPDMSAALMPESVYGTDVPEARFVVIRVKVAEDPSLTEELLAPRL